MASSMLKSINTHHLLSSNHRHCFPLTHPSPRPIICPKFVHYPLNLKRAGNVSTKLVPACMGGRPPSPTPAFAPGDGGVEDDVRLFPREGSLLQFSGLDSTFNRMSKWIVCVVLISMATWRRHDGEAMWTLTGFLINALLSITLKKIIKQERPLLALRSGSGMPSSHSQSIFFILVFLGFSVVEWLGINKLSFTLNGLILAFASYLSWLRVSQQFHTTSQVVVGATLGASFATMWHWSWKTGILLLVLGSIGYLFWTCRILDQLPSTCNQELI